MKAYRSFPLITSIEKAMIAQAVCSTKIVNSNEFQGKPGGKANLGRWISDVRKFYAVPIRLFPIYSSTLAASFAAAENRLSQRTRLYDTTMSCMIDRLGIIFNRPGTALGSDALGNINNVLVIREMTSHDGTKLASVCRSIHEICKNVENDNTLPLRWKKSGALRIALYMLEDADFKFIKRAFRVIYKPNVMTLMPKSKTKAKGFQTWLEVIASGRGDQSFISNFRNRMD